MRKLKRKHLIFNNLEEPDFSDNIAEKKLESKHTRKKKMLQKQFFISKSEEVVPSLQNSVSVRGGVVA